MKPGDMCVVVDTPEWYASADIHAILARTLIGKTCVLVGGPIVLTWGDHNRRWSPFWKISGLEMPAFFSSNLISEKVLRRIDPPTEEILNTEELTV